MKKKAKTGTFLRWYGPRNDRSHALLVETRIDEDTPAAFYKEPTRSSFEQCERVRGNTR